MEKKESRVARKKYLKQQHAVANVRDDERRYLELFKTKLSSFNGAQRAMRMKQQTARKKR
jgi:hypothetical protein